MDDRYGCSLLGHLHPRSNYDTSRSHVSCKMRIKELIRYSSHFIFPDKHLSRLKLFPKKSLSTVLNPKKNSIQTEGDAAGETDSKTNTADIVYHEQVNTHSTILTKFQSLEMFHNKYCEPSKTLAHGMSREQALQLNITWLT
jgi:hypothetical protein